MMVDIGEAIKRKWVPLSRSASEAALGVDKTSLGLFQASKYGYNLHDHYFSSVKISKNYFQWLRLF